MLVVLMLHEVGFSLRKDVTTDCSGEFPHQIMLTRGVGGSLMCGGSLVAPDVVVTAGHCCDG